MNILIRRELLHKLKYLPLNREFVISISLGLFIILCLAFATMILLCPLRVSFLITMGIITIVATFIKPVCGMLAMPFVYYLYIITNYTAGTYWLRPIFTLMSVLIFSWLFEKILLRNFYFVKSPQIFVFLLMLITMICSTMEAVVSKEVSWEGNIEMFKLFIFFLLLINLLNSITYINLFLWIIGFACTLISFRGIRGYLAWGVTRLEGFGGGGQIVNSNELCGALLMILPFLFYKIFSKNRIEKILGIIWTPLVLFCIILTNSRGGAIALAFMLILILIRAFRNIKNIIPIATILIVTSFLVPQDFWDRMRSISEYEQDVSAMGRIELWKAGMRMWKDHPLTGIGQNNFEILISQYYVDKFGGQEIISAHNTFVQLFVEGGIQTLLLFLLLIFLSFKDLWFVARKFPKNFLGVNIPDLAFSIGVGLAGFLISCIFMSRVYFVPLYWFIGLPIALKDVIKRELKKKDK